MVGSNNDDFGLKMLDFKQSYRSCTEHSHIYKYGSGSIRSLEEQTHFWKSPCFHHLCIQIETFSYLFLCKSFNNHDDNIVKYFIVCCFYLLYLKNCLYNWILLNHCCFICQFQWHIWHVCVHYCCVFCMVW